MKLDGNNHSVFLMYYHLIPVTKYHRNIIGDAISNQLREIFEYTVPDHSISIQEWFHDNDYVHILFKGHLNSELSRFINAYKSASSRPIKKRELKNKRKALEGILLVKKLLSAHNRRCTLRGYPSIY